MKNADEQVKTNMKDGLKEQSKGAEGENVDGDVLKLSIGKDIGSPSLRIQDSHTVPVTSAPDKCERKEAIFISDNHVPSKGKKVN